jgi:outer membrane protein OmpA-like peptidoglycan-associated protein
MAYGRRRRSLGTLALALVPSLAGAADAPYAAGPWDAATEAAAEAAVARLGPQRFVTIQATVINVTGLTAGVTANVQQLRQAMQDLAAKETDLEVHVELPADVLFDFDKADIRADAASALAKVATIIRAYPSGNAALEGHTDAKGNDAYNQRLSERRAESVRRWLTEKERLEPSKLGARGWGAHRPVATNDTDEGRQRNRRVEVVIRKGR